MTMVLLILGALTALHAVVAACELAVMTARPTRLQALADRGNRGARRALLLQRDSSAGGRARRRLLDRRQ